MSAKPARKPAANVGKSAPKSPRTVGKPFVKGTDPRQGRGPRPGAPNAGRPSNAFKAYMAKLVDKVEVRKGVEDILTDPGMRHDPAKGRLYLDAFKFAAEHAHGRPVQPVEAQADLTLTVRFEK